MRHLTEATMKHGLCIPAFLLSMILFFVCTFLGCTDSRYMIKKEKQIAHMTDTELTSYYQGLTDRIKDIDNNFRNTQDLMDPPEHEPRSRFPEPHYLGSESYDLHQIRELVVQEMRKRNLSIP